MVTFGDWISSTPTELNNAFFLLRVRITILSICLRKGRKTAQQGRRNKKEIRISNILKDSEDQDSKKTWYQQNLG